MAWWAWMVIGMLLLVAELFIVEADFFLVFLGVAAFTTGLVVLFGPELAPWIQWIVFAMLGIVGMLFFRKRLYRVLRREVPDMRDDMLGQELFLPAELPAGRTLRVEHGGSQWTARNVDATDLPSGARVRVVGMDGIVLKVSKGE